jgi:protein-disulfide isomerase
MDTKTNYLIPISIIIAGALIGIGIYLGSGRTINQPVNTNVPPENQEINIAPVNEEDHVLGNRNAKIAIIEYSDLECPFCKVFHETLHRVIDKYGPNGDVAWVYRHFPLTELHPTAAKEAEASECAADQGGNDAFWKYVDEIYSITPGNKALDQAELPKIAGRMGLDVNKFNECFNSGKFESKVTAQRQEAISAGGRGTPYTILVSEKGKLPITQGAISFEQLSELIDQMLADL